MKEAKPQKTKADKMATASAISSIIGALLDMFIIGLPFTIAGLVLAIMALRDGNFTEYDDASYSSYEEKISHKVRAYVGIVLGAMGIAIVIIGFANM